MRINFSVWGKGSPQNVASYALLHESWRGPPQNCRPDVRSIERTTADTLDSSSLQRAPWEVRSPAAWVGGTAWQGKFGSPFPAVSPSL